MKKKKRVTMFVKYGDTWFPIEGHFVRRHFGGKNHLMFRDEWGQEHSERQYSSTETEANRKRREAQEAELLEVEEYVLRWKDGEFSEN